VRPYESALSIVLKYLNRNHVSRFNWQQLIFGNESESNSLLTGQGVIRPRPVIAAGEAIVRGTLRSYGARWRCGLTISERVRPCPECRAEGSLYLFPDRKPTFLPNAWVTIDRLLYELRSQHAVVRSSRFPTRPALRLPKVWCRDRPVLAHPTTCPWPRSGQAPSRLQSLKQIWIRHLYLMPMSRPAIWAPRLPLL
jgi:hypothetical protein